MSKCFAAAAAWFRLTKSNLCASVAHSWSRILYFRVFRWRRGGCPFSTQGLLRNCTARRHLLDRYLHGVTRYPCGAQLHRSHARSSISRDTKIHLVTIGRTGITDCANHFG